MRVSAGQRLRLAVIFNFILIMLINSADGLGIDHCYSDIGCFPLGSEFYHQKHRPFNVRPWHRRRIKTHFELYSRDHPNGFLLRPWNSLNLLASGFNPMLETKIIIPGWLDNIKRALWVRKLKDSLLWLWDPVNIIVIHWRNFTPYTIATANTRVVGAELANLLKFIEAELNYDRSYYHLIGHSLGAHIGGYCGDRIPGLGRISALDPARPFFQHMPKSVRLDRSDARFVDAIHSDFTPENAIFLLMSFGMTTPVGHVDFYPNGPPIFQPGCLRDSLLSIQNGIVRGLRHRSLSIAFLEAVRYLTACDHQRAHEWFIESITNRKCVFVGVRCNEYEGMINGRCNCDDSPSACAVMGIHADQMYLNNAHEDLWPLGGEQFSRTHPNNQLLKPSAGSQMDEGQQLGRPITRDQVYANLRHQSDRLRHPDLYKVVPDSQSLQLHDQAFVELLKSSLSMGPLDFETAGYKQRPQVPFASNLDVELELELKDDDLSLAELIASQLQLEQLHPKLMSDFDRDIESWYEESSRWFLRTNNRPNYCVNQYQVLVFIGPLKSTSGHKRLRANLVISIIGSRGQLMNQRFVPRSANLDSFTMQPFFIILEGAYSLGNILSVAISWEARLDPEPIQATVSFESNILENIESFWPTYRMKHPILPATLKYDLSGVFDPKVDQIRQSPSEHEPISASSQNPAKLEERASSFGRPAFESAARRDMGAAIFGCSAKRNKAAGQCTAIVEDGLHNLERVDNPLDGEGLIGSFVELNEDGDLTRRSRSWPHHANNDDKSVEKSSQAPRQLRSQTTGSHELSRRYMKEHNRLTAKLHNIGIHYDRDLEDSIVVNQVVVSPLQANYGRDSFKVGRAFCPPSQNFRLRRDQTVRLVPNLATRCGRPSNGHHPADPSYG